MVQLRFRKTNLLHSALILLIDGIDRIFGFRHQGFKFLFVSDKLLNLILSFLGYTGPNVLSRCCERGISAVG